MSDAQERLCDPNAIEQASFETLAQNLVALCANAVAQDEKKRELVAALRTGAERARALEAEIQHTEGKRSA